MIPLYKAITILIYPFLVLIIFFRKMIKKEDPRRYKEKILVSHFNVKRNKSKLIWFHAASIGEFKSIVPIIENLNKNKENLEFLITTITFSSGDLARQDLKKFDNVYHRFLPIDVGFIINKFLNLWKPSAIFLVDSEIWPNLILKAKEKGISIGIINARITFKTFKRWMLFPKTANKIFSTFGICLTSNLETKKYLIKLKAKKINFLGNIKLINKNNKKKNINNQFKSLKRFWFAASTHEGEEKICLKAHIKIKEKYKNIVTILAPRHINRIEDIKILCKNYNLTFQVLNKKQVISKNKEVIIINYFGGLYEFFRNSKSVFMGKSTIIKLKNDSGQNPIEAAKLGCKIYHGPYVYNFKEIYNTLRNKKITKKINSHLDLSNALIKDLVIPQKINMESSYINNLGKKTLTSTMKEINNFIFNEIK
tara:strand:+ start:534 stop:1805 length:1272 start_codon:yes stop_codon:yes gene_type:complete